MPDITTRAIPRLPWWTWLAPLIISYLGTRASLFLQQSQWAPVGYLPVALGLVMVLWWGPRALIGIFLNALLSAGLWGFSRGWLTPVYALPETLAVFIGWLFFERIAHGKSWLPNLYQLLMFLLLGILPAALFYSFLAATQFFALGNLPLSAYRETVTRLTLTIVLDGLGFTIPIAVFLTHFMERKGWTRLTGSEPPALLPHRRISRLGWLELVLTGLALTLLVVLMPYDLFWYLYWLFLIGIALRFGFSIVLLAVMWIELLLVYLPDLGSSLLGKPMQEHLLSGAYVILMLSFITALVIGRSISDILDEVHQRRRTETELRDREERFRAVIEQASVGIARVTLDGHILEINQRFADILGYSQAQLQGTNVKDITYPADFPAEVDAIKSFFTTGKKSLEFEKRFLHKDGSIIWAELSASLVRGEDGAPQYMVAVVQDINRRKQAEIEATLANQTLAATNAALRVSEEKFFKAFHASPGAVIIAGMVDGRILDVNLGFERTFGYSSAEVIGRTVFDLHLWLQPDLRQQIVFHIMTEGPVYNMDWNFQTRSGEHRLGRISADLIQINGKPYVFSITEDITERRRAEDALHDSERKFRSIIEQSMDGIALLDEEGTILEWNPSRETMTGIPRSEAVGQRFWDVMVRYVIDEQKAVLQKGYIRDQVTGILRTGIVPAPLNRAAISAMKRPDGTIRDIEQVVFPIQTEKGFMVASVTRDITERRQTDMRLHRRMVEMEAVNRVSSAMRSAITLKTMLPALIDETLAVLDAPAGAILLYESSTQKLEAGVSRGWLDAVISRALEMNWDFLSNIIRSRQPLCTGDFSLIPILGDQALDAFPAGWGGIIQPILAVDEVVGLLFITVQQPRTLSDDEVRLLDTISEIAGNAIYRTRLNESTRRSLERLAALHEIDGLITSGMGLRETLVSILDFVLRHLKVSAADVLLLDPSEQYLEFTAGKGFSLVELERFSVRFGEEMAGQAVQERRRVMGSEIIPSYERTVREELLEAEGFISGFAVPLYSNDRVTGVLEVFHTMQISPQEEWLDFMETLAGQISVAVEKIRAREDQLRTYAELLQAYNATIEGWSRALDLRDKETEGHTQRVTRLSLLLAREMGFQEPDLTHIARGALLHDIGKIGVPDEILHKPDVLNEKEWVIMRCHPRNAFDLISPIDFLQPAIEIPYYHHERWDGSGYPFGMRGEEIPLPARLFAVVDVWDALTSDRVYRPAWSREKARDYLRSLAGVQFDAQIVEVFLDHIDAWDDRVFQTS